MQSLPVVVLGFMLGMLHATDADHVVAVTTIVSRQRSVSGAACVGLLWGVGHTVTVFAVGTAIILFNLVIPPRVELAMEFCVALMLILLGVVSLSRLSGHGHQHGHGHAERGGAPARLGWLARRFSGIGLYQALRPLSVGIVHGLAGSAAVALLVLTQIRAPLWAVAYLLLFGVGTIAGMMLITSVIAVPFTRTQRSPALNLGMQVASGALSLGVGGYMAWAIGVPAGWFTAFL